MINEEQIKIVEWEKELQPVIAKIAQQESALKLYETMGSDEKAGEKDVNLGGKAAKVNVTAAEAIKNVKSFLEKANQHKEIIFKLIKDAESRK